VPSCRHWRARAARPARRGPHLHDHLDSIIVVNAPRMDESFGLSFGGALRMLGGIFEWRSRRSGMLTTNFAEAGGFVRSRPEEEHPTCSCTS
jgi:choline dehydrogenase-like flavoprotein